MVVPADDLPSEVLRVIFALRKLTGGYTRFAAVTPDVGARAGLKPGIWMRNRGGLWAWEADRPTKK